jgi:hypothetical protein
MLKSDGKHVARMYLTKFRKGMWKKVVKLPDYKPANKQLDNFKRSMGEFFQILALKQTKEKLVMITIAASDWK